MLDTREQSNGTTVSVDRASSQMAPLCMWTERAVKWYTVHVDRESSQVVSLCIWTERAVKWYHVHVDRENSQVVSLCMWTERAVKWYYRETVSSVNEKQTIQFKNDNS